jgi:transcription-repair coupling factor (superfamily II helicase)
MLRPNAFMIFWNFRRSQFWEYTSNTTRLFCLCTKDLLTMKTKLPVTRITKYLNATINSASKRLFEKQNITLKELTTLSVGDYVTYWPRNWTFWRVAKIQVEGKTQEAIKLVYADNDIVYVSIHSHTKFQNTTEKTERLPKFTNWVECLEDFKTKPGARQTYCIQLDSVVC